MGLSEMTDEEFADYCRQTSAAYFAEEDEMKEGTHPTQVKERIEKALHDAGYQYKEITYLDWNPEGPRVRVSVDDVVYGIFNYSTNEFEYDVNSDNKSDGIVISISEELASKCFPENATKDEIQQIVEEALYMHYSMTT